ncbi:unnamed protein product [Danaus chrysippus]|uniref:(African queen) hypothetical protein n=1 Tax=Danaus chrysippus TaxID=151541 RepID=A0A8J2VU81_9NEOP|nr:unnamed protein product [Danaus chrysippus]
MAGRDNSDGQLTHVIHHVQPVTEAQVSVHQVHQGSGSGKRHQIIIDIKQDIDISEMSTRSLAESVMESLGARSAAVYIDNAQIPVQNSTDMESLTTVNVIVANDLTQTASPEVTEVVEDSPAESPGILPGNRIAVDRIVEMTTSTPNETSTSTSITTTATTTASGITRSAFNIGMY